MLTDAGLPAALGPLWDERRKFRQCHHEPQVFFRGHMLRLRRSHRRKRGGISTFPCGARRWLTLSATAGGSGARQRLGGYPCVAASAFLPLWAAVPTLWRRFWYRSGVHSDVVASAPRPAAVGNNHTEQPVGSLNTGHTSGPDAPSQVLLRHLDVSSLGRRQSRACAEKARRRRLLTMPGSSL